MLRMIALDLDGTLLRSDKTLSARTRQVLESYIAKGTHVVVASGRSYDSLPQEVLSVSGIDYAITSNGVVICHRPTGEKLFYSPLKPACTQQLLSLIQTHHAEFEVFLVFMGEEFYKQMNFETFSKDYHSKYRANMLSKIYSEK